MSNLASEAFEGYLNETLPMIDEYFDRINLEVHKRPFSVACHIVDFFIVDIKGDTKDNYLVKPWFVELCHCVADWYEKRYGEKQIQSPEHALRGLVMHHSTLYQLTIPITLKTPGERNTTWIKFPIEVFPSENIFDWIVPNLPVETFTSKKRTNFAKQISIVASYLRVINNDLGSASFIDKKTRSLANSVLRHFEKAALDASSHDRSNSSLAIWELTLACEKTIKTYLIQKNIPYPKTHNLRDLHKLADVDSSWHEEKKAISAIPNEDKVIAWRYEEYPPPTQKEIMRIYLACLTLCCLYAGRMQRKLVFKNFSMQIRNPPRIN